MILGTQAPLLRLNGVGETGSPDRALVEQSLRSHRSASMNRIFGET